MTNQAVIDKVEKEGETFQTETTILGVRYLNIYFPLKTELGKITGMVSTFRSKSIISATIFKVVRFVSTFTLIFVLVLCVASGAIIVRLLRPLKDVKRTFVDICSGEADLTKRINVNVHDEIGDVVSGFNAFADKLQKIISHMKDSKGMLDTAGVDLQQTAQDTASAVHEILANITSIHSQVAEQKQSVEQTAGSITKISDNIFALNNMVENQSSSVTEASAAVEEMIGNITSVNHSMEKMAGAFNDLQEHSHRGFDKLAVVNERVQEIEEQSKMLEEANSAIASIASQRIFWR